MLKNILNDCEDVVEISKHVKINVQNINEFVNNIDKSKIQNKYWLENNPFGILDFSIQDLMNFLFIYTSINFSFWGNPKWKKVIDGNEEDGSIALMHILANYMKKNDILNLGNLTYEEFRNLLRGNIDIPLVKKRYEIILNVCKIIKDRMNGNIYEYIKNMNIDEDLFEFIINNFNNFYDEEIYEGKKVEFYKLAQLLTSDILHIRKIKENIDVDYSNLVGCADYKIPQILRMYNLIEYDKKLSRLVDNKKELKPYSNYEIEIRAATIVVINILKEKLNVKNAIDINDFIWLQGQKGLNVKPNHLVRTNLY